MITPRKTIVGASQNRNAGGVFLVVIEAKRSLYYRDDDMTMLSSICPIRPWGQRWRWRDQQQ